MAFIKKDGEVDFPVTVDFWDWWKKAVSYIETRDEADFCFIYDKDYDLLHDEFLENINQVSDKDSIWDINYVKNFFWELKPIYFSVCLIDQNGEEYYLNGKKSSNIAQKRFYTNLVFSVKESANANGNSESEDDIVPIDEGNISDVAKYFVDLLRKERGYE